MAADPTMQIVVVAVGLGLLGSIAACGANVTGEGGAPNEAAGGGGGQPLTTAASGGLGNGGTAGAGATTTVTVGSGGSPTPALCEDLCATLTACGERSTDCEASCGAALAGSCPQSYEDFAACLTTAYLPPDCAADACAPLREDWLTCEMSFCQFWMSSTSSGPPQTCTWGYHCPLSDVQSSCTIGPMGSTCSCSGSAYGSGSCSTDATNAGACDPVGGCCAGIFFGAPFVESPAPEPGP